MRRAPRPSSISNFACARIPAAAADVCVWRHIALKLESHTQLAPTHSPNCTSYLPTYLPTSPPLDPAPPAELPDDVPDLGCTSRAFPGIPLVALPWVPRGVVDAVTAVRASDWM